MRIPEFISSECDRVGILDELLSDQDLLVVFDGDDFLKERIKNVQDGRERIIQHVSTCHHVLICRSGSSYLPPVFCLSENSNNELLVVAHVTSDIHEEDSLISNINIDMETLFAYISSQTKFDGLFMNRKYLYCLSLDYSSKTKEYLYVSKELMLDIS